MQTQCRLHSCYKVQAHLLKTKDKSSECPCNPILYPDSAKRSIARITSPTASIRIVNPPTPLVTAATYKKNKYKIKMLHEKRKLYFLNG